LKGGEFANIIHKSSLFAKYNISIGNWNHLNAYTFLGGFAKLEILLLSIPELKFIRK